MDGEVKITKIADKEKLQKYKENTKDIKSIQKFDKMGRKKRNPTTYGMNLETYNNILDNRNNSHKYKML